MCEVQFQETIARRYRIERTPDLIESLADPGSWQVGQWTQRIGRGTNPGLINGSTGSIFIFSSKAMTFPLFVSCYMS